MVVAARGPELPLHPRRAAASMFDLHVVVSVMMLPCPLPAEKAEIHEKQRRARVVLWVVCGGEKGSGCSDRGFVCDGTGQSRAWQQPLSYMETVQDA